MSGSTTACDDLRLPHGLRYARLYPCPEPLPGPGWPAGSYLTQITEPPAEQEKQS